MNLTNIFKAFLVLGFFLVAINCQIEPKKVLESHQANYWNDPTKLGPKLSFIDTSGEISLFEDNRVSQVYKDYYPNFTKLYTLYRVSHDSSCWIQSGMVTFCYGLLKVPPETSKEVLAKLKKKGDNFVTDYFQDFKNSPDYEKFFDVFDHILSLKDFKKTLDFIQHKNVADIWKKGLRYFLAVLKKDPKYIDPKEWGDVRAFATLFKPGQIPFDGAFLEEGHSAGYKIFLSFISTSKLTSEQLEALKKLPHPKDQSIFIDNIINNVPNFTPKVLYFRSKPGFMDIAVRRSYSDELNASL